VSDMLRIYKVLPTEYDNSISYYEVLTKVKYKINEIIDALDTKVDKEEGKGLSTNDFTNLDKSKLNTIQAGAEVNIIDTIAVNGTNQQIANKRVNITVPTKTSELINDSYFMNVNYSENDKKIIFS